MINLDVSRSATRILMMNITLGVSDDQDEDRPLRPRCSQRPR